MAQLIARLAQKVKSKRYPFFYTVVLLPRVIRTDDIDLLLRRFKDEAEREQVTIEDKQSLPFAEWKRRTTEAVLTVKFTYNWSKKVQDYHFMSHPSFEALLSRSDFISVVQQVLQLLFEKGAKLILRVFQSGILVQEIRVPSHLKNQPGFSEALSFAALVPLWTIVLDELAKIPERLRQKGIDIGFPEILIKDRQLFPWGYGFDKVGVALDKSITEFVNIATSIESRAIADGSFHKIFELKGTCSIFLERAQHVKSTLNVKDQTGLNKLSHKILELEFRGMQALYNSLSSIDQKVEKIVYIIEKVRV